jgi:hypothetical protein
MSAPVVKKLVIHSYSSLANRIARRPPRRVGGLATD